MCRQLFVAALAILVVATTAFPHSQDAVVAEADGESLLQVPSYITTEEDLDAWFKSQGTKVVETKQGVPMSAEDAQKIEDGDDVEVPKSVGTAPATELYQGEDSDNMIKNLLRSPAPKPPAHRQTAEATLVNLKTKSKQVMQSGTIPRHLPVPMRIITGESTRTKPKKPVLSKRAKAKAQEK